MSYARLDAVAYKALCAYVLRRDGWRCRACNYRNTLSVHHCLFRSAGGGDTKENLAVICALCHDDIHVNHSLVVVGDNADIPGGMKFLRVPKEW